MTNEVIIIASFVSFSWDLVQLISIWHLNLLVPSTWLSSGTLVEVWS